MTPLNEQIINKLEDLANLIPSTEVEGEELEITDCAGVRPIDVKIKGSIYQDGEPDPNNSIDIEVLTGDVTITINNTEYPLSLGDLELCGNSTYGYDYLFKSGGKWYKHQKWNNITLNGTENWTYNSTYNYFYCNDYSYDNAPISPVTSGYQYNTHFTMNSKWSTFRDTIDTDMIYYIGSGGYMICIRYLSCTTIDEFISWLNENNITVYYMVNDELNEEITDTTLISQLEKISNAKLTKNNTVISSNNERCIIDLTYYKDIEKMIG